MKKYTWMVNGCSADGVETSNLEKMVENEFGNHVVGDSEHSALYIMCESEEIAEEVLEFVNVYGHAGEMVTTIGGMQFPAKFSSKEMYEPYEAE